MLGHIRTQEDIGQHDKRRVLLIHMNKMTHKDDKIAKNRINENSNESQF